MKGQFNYLPKVKHFRHFLSRKGFYSLLSLVLVLAILNLSASCQTYLRVNTHTNSEGRLPSKLIELKSQGKYFIAFLDGNAWRLNNINVDEDNAELAGSIETLPSQWFNRFHLVSSKNRSLQSTDMSILEEVHLHIAEYSKNEEANVIIPFSGIERVYEHNLAIRAKTRSILIGLGITVAIVFVAYSTIMVLLLLSWSDSY